MLETRRFPIPFERAVRDHARRSVDAGDLQGRRLLASLYLRQTALSLLFAFLGYLATLILIYRQLPWRLDLIWAVLAGAMLVHAIVRRLRSERIPLTEERAAHLLRGAPILCGFLGTVWGAAAFTLPYLGEGATVALTAVAFALVVAATVTLSAVPRAALAFILPASVPYLAAYLMSPSWTAVLLGLLGIIFVAVMLVGLRLGSAGLMAEVEAREAAISARAAAEAAEAAHAASQRRWGEFSRAAEAFALFDADGGLMLWNEPYRRLFGLDKGALFTGARPADYLPEGTEETAEARYVIRRERTALDTNETAQRGGRWYRSAAAILSTGEISITHMDVTELKENETKLLALRDVLVAQRNKAEGASEAKSNFLAKMSHELRTPLNAVIGFADLIVQDHDRGRSDPQRHSGYARLISGSGRHLLAIVDDLLDLTRIETGRMTMRETEVDLCELMRSARLLVEGRGDERRIHFEEHFPDTPTVIWGDRRLLSQAVLNLMENSAKFCTDDPRIELYVAHAKGGRGGIDLIVRDNGIGISPELLEKVQTPFFQVEDSETRRFGGIGLGLALVREFTEMHGGELYLTLPPEGGLEARINLPEERLLTA